MVNQNVIKWAPFLGPYHKVQTNNCRVEPSSCTMFCFLSKIFYTWMCHNMEEKICHNLKPSKIYPRLRALQVP